MLPISRRIESLTPAECRILELWPDHPSGRELAYLLRISQQTVKNHITRILHKLACTHVGQAAIHYDREDPERVADVGRAATDLARELGLGQCLVGLDARSPATRIHDL